MHRIILSTLLSIAALLVWGTPAQAQFLQGGVEHAETLPPVDKRLQTGSEFDDKYFDNERPNNLWVPIPSWFAGVWRTRTETMLQTVDLQDPDNSVSYPRVMKRNDKWIFGMQVDRTGQIWHFINVPSHRKVLINTDYEYRNETSKEFLYSGEERVLYRIRFVAFTVDSRSRRITESRQQETQWLFTPAPDGTMRGDNSFKTFSPKGIPLSVCRNFAPFYRAQEFAPIDIYNGIDMRKSFREYLLSHKMADRIPADDAQ